MNNYVKVFLLNINIVNNRYFLILWVVFYYYLFGESNLNLLVLYG